MTKHCFSHRDNSVVIFLQSKRIVIGRKPSRASLGSKLWIWKCLPTDRNKKDQKRRGVRAGLMVSMLDANMLNGSSRRRNHCAVFLSKVLLFSRSLFLPRKINFYLRIARKPEENQLWTIPLQWSKESCDILSTSCYKDSLCCDMNFKRVPKIGFAAACLHEYLVSVSYPAQMSAWSNCFETLPMPHVVNLIAMSKWPLIDYFLL